MLRTDGLVFQHSKYEAHGGGTSLLVIIHDNTILRKPPLKRY